MKNYFIFFILYISLQIRFSKCVEYDYNKNLDDYLDKQSNFLNETLNEETDIDDINEIEVDTNFFGNFNHNGNSTNINIFSFFNSTFFLIENEIFRSVLHNGFKMELYSNFNFPAYSDVIFFKTKQFNNIGIMVMCIKPGIANIYSFSEDNIITLIQSILVLEATDAHFFINLNHLYLIVTTNKGDNIAVTSIYKWLFTHFDEIDTILTTGAIKVSSFSTKHTEMLMILQHVPGKKVYSLLYEFKYDKVKKVQQIRTKNPSHIDTFINENRTYVIIYEKSKNHTMYYWSVSKLIFSGKFSSEQSITKSIVVYDELMPIIVAPQLDKVLLYKPHSKNMRLEDTKGYRANYSVILDINKGRNENGNITFIVGLNEDNIININAMSFKVHTETRNEQENNLLRECFTNLEQKIYDKRRKFDVTETVLAQVRSSSDQDDFNNSSKDDTLVSISLQEEQVIENRIYAMRARVKDLNSLIEYKDLENEIIISGPSTMKGLVSAKTLIAQDVHIKKINNKKWIPEQWLKYFEPQTITGPIDIRNITTNILVTSDSETFFKDLLLKKGNQVLYGQASIGNLSAVKMQTNNINDIPMDDIYLKSQPKLIKGLKSFENMNVSKLNILKTFNGEKPDKMLSHLMNKSSDFEFDSNVFVKNLWVESVDHVNWNEFKDSVFRVGLSNTINGSFFVPELKTGNLNIKTLSGVPVKDFLTTSTDQTIESDIEFNNVFAENISVDTVNNISLKKSAALINENATIKGPVKIDKIHVLKDLELIGEVDMSLFLTKDDHIIGTNESDLLQRYNGNVNIKGNLYLKNLTLHPDLRLFISENEFNPNVVNRFWTKSTQQTIPIHFEAIEGISTPHLLTHSINDVPVEKFMLNQNSSNTLETIFNFENVTILGDVLLNSQKIHSPDLEAIDKNTVKTTGSFKISGTKTFTNNLKIKKLVTNNLEGINVEDALTTVNPVIVSGKKIFENFVVTGDVSTDIQSLNVINEVAVKKLQENALYIDEPQNMEKLNFKNISVSNLNVSTLNNHLMSEYMPNLEKMFATEKIADMFIEGNVSIENAQNVIQINNISVEELLDNKPTDTTDKADIEGNVKFLGKVKVKNLQAAFINDINFPELTTRFFYKKTNQIVTASYTFKNLEAENMIVKNINGKNVSTLIDVTSVRPQTIFAPNGVKFTSAKFLKSVNASKILPCNIEDAVENIKMPPSQYWIKVKIMGNATLVDENCNLRRIFERTVRMNSENTITAPVKFTSHILTKNIVTSEHINDVNIEDIINDALLTDATDEQVVTGHKMFPQIEAQTARVLENSDIPVVNSIHIPELYEKIIPKEIINQISIRGKKTLFGGLQTKRFYSNEVAGVIPENIVSLSSLRKIPSAIFDTLEVENDLNIKHVNNLDVDYIINNRLLTLGPVQTTNATYFFENLNITENMQTPLINQIELHNAIFDIGEQVIKSSKRFTDSVEIFGNARVEYLNGIDISQTYEKAVLHGEKTNIDGSVLIKRPSKVLGNITAETINGYPVNHIKEILNKGYTKAEQNTIYEIKERLVHLVKDSLPFIKRMPTEYLYIEKSDSLQVAVPNTVNAQATKTKDYVLIHVLGKDTSDKCGLPKDCSCPVQHSLEITPQHSVSYFVNKGQQRIYSYDEDNMIIHFITNSISTDTKCRTDKTKVFNEVSSLTWNTINTQNSTGSFNLYPKYFTGYISGVQFFTLNGKTYAIIARYYDPVTDSHDLESVVIVFSEDKTSASEIQKIPTKGAWTLYLFHTAQGVTLIIGNVNPNSQEHSSTVIYRFNQHREKFEILKTIPTFECIDAAGVVLGTDSLIILSHKTAPLQILKYDSNLDNYYFYQSFELDGRVLGINVFYTGGFGISDAYLCIVTGNENYYIYSFQFIDGWKLESSGGVEGLRNLIPFDLNKQLYLFAPSTKISSLLTIVKHG